MSETGDNRWGNICERVDACALTGAAAFAAGIPGAEVLANGPLWCYFYALRHLEHAEYGMAERFHGSQPDNNAVVYGTEKYLLEALERLLRQGHSPSLLLIESSCSLSLIGDDLEGIARRAELPFPFVTMDCGGMLGGFAEGYARAGVKILERFAGESAPEPSAVNLLGMTDFYLNGAADRREICRLLELAGYTVQAVPGGGSSLEELRSVGRASLNIVINEELGLPLAQYLKRRFGTPYVLAGMPYGVEGSCRWLERIHAALPAPQRQRVLEEAERTGAFLSGWLNECRSQWGNPWFDAAVVSGPPTVALCLSEALRKEWADMAELTVLCQRSLPAAEPGYYCSCADAVYTAGSEDYSLEHCLKKGRLLLLGSSSESSFLYRQGYYGFVGCNIAFPANDEIFLLQKPFAGLEGSGYMLQRLWNAYIARSLEKQVKK